jgi:malonyl CoA-acyl carrier protein transacylase
MKEIISPKQKAEELVNQYRMILMDEDTECGNELLCTSIAIKCALLAVDEILELTKKPTYNPFDWNEVTGVHYDKYWLEVKHEIKNL